MIQFYVSMDVFAQPREDDAEPLLANLRVVQIHHFEEGCEPHGVVPIGWADLLCEFNQKSLVVVLVGDV